MASSCSKTVFIKNVVINCTHDIIGNSFEDFKSCASTGTLIIGVFWQGACIDQKNVPMDRSFLLFQLDRNTKESWGSPRVPHVKLDFQLGYDISQLGKFCDLTYKWNCDYQGSFKSVTLNIESKFEWEEISPQTSDLESGSDRSSEET